MISKQTNPPQRSKKIKLLHILIWVSLITCIASGYYAIKTLYEHIEISKNIVGLIHATFDSDTLQKLNTFALETYQETQQSTHKFFSVDKGIYANLAWNLLLDDQTITMDQMIHSVKDRYSGSFNQELFQAATSYWKNRLSQSPDLLQLFKRYTQIMVRGRHNASGIVPGHISIWISLDNNMNGFVSVLNSAPWWEQSVYPGLSVPNDVVSTIIQTTDDQQEGYFYYATFDSTHYFMPQYLIEDDGSKWFRVWHVQKSGEKLSFVKIDFNVYSEAFMQRIFLISLAGLVGGMIVLLILVFIVLIKILISQLSRLKKEPIEATIKQPDEIKQPAHKIFSSQPMNTSSQQPDEIKQPTHKIFSSQPMNTSSQPMTTINRSDEIKQPDNTVLTPEPINNINITDKTKITPVFPPDHSFEQSTKSDMQQKSEAPSMSPSSNTLSKEQPKALDLSLSDKISEPKNRPNQEKREEPLKLNLTMTEDESQIDVSQQNETITKSKLMFTTQTPKPKGAQSIKQELNIPSPEPEPEQRKTIKSSPPNLLFINK